MRTSQADTWRNPNNDHLVKHTHTFPSSALQPLLVDCTTRGEIMQQHPAGWCVGSTPRSNKSRRCPANNHPSAGRLCLQSKVKGLQEHEAYFIQYFRYERPGQMPPLHQEHIYCVLQQLPTSSQLEFIFLNLTDLREVKAELWEVIRPQHGINKRHVFLQENTEDQAEDKELLLTQLLRPHADFYQKGRKLSHHRQT